MKKLLFFVFILLLCACKKDKNQQIYSESQIIGKWIYDSYKLNGVKYPYEHHLKCDKDRFYFVNRPGQDHFYDEIIYMKLDYCAISSTNMVWKLKGENLILNFGKQAFIYRILKLNETNFDVAIKIDFNGDGKEDDVEIYAVRGDCTHDSYCQ